MLVGTRGCSVCFCFTGAYVSVNHFQHVAWGFGDRCSQYKCECGCGLGPTLLEWWLSIVLLGVPVRVPLVPCSGATRCNLAGLALCIRDGRLCSLLQASRKLITSLLVNGMKISSEVCPFALPVHEQEDCSSDLHNVTAVDTWHLVIDMMV